MPSPNHSQERFESELQRKLADCDVAPSQVEIKYADDLQDYAVTITTPATRLNAHNYACLARLSAETGQFLLFQDEAATPRFWQARKEASRNAARTWIEQRGLLAKLPAFDPEKQHLTEYARALETFCGIEPGTVLVAASPTHLAFGDLMKPQPGEDQFMCLIHAVTASNLRERGVFFGFIGNEIATEPNSPE